MMDFAELLLLFRYYEATRRVGHTHILINGIREANEPFFFMAVNRRHAESLLNECAQGKNGTKNGTVLVVSERGNVDRMRGCSDPLVVDNGAVMAILSSCINEMEISERTVRDKLAYAELELLTARYAVEQFEEEGIVGFLKRKVKRWTTEKDRG